MLVICDHSDIEKRLSLARADRRLRMNCLPYNIPWTKDDWYIPKFPKVQA